MSKGRAQLIEWIEHDKDHLIHLASELIRAESPNPPGDTRKVAAVAEAYLADNSLSYKTVQMRDDRPNLIADFDCVRAGRRLSLNGHMDVLPVDEHEVWKHSPWGGVIDDGKIWGRGATNMKCGLAVALSVFTYISRLRSELCGSVVFSAVSDEIILGDMGAVFLMDEAPEILGDVCLMAEPSGLGTLRFGQKGPMRLHFKLEDSATHAAFTHLAEGAISKAVRLIDDLLRLNGHATPSGDPVADTLGKATQAIDDAQGVGAHKIADKLTLAVTMIRGGVAKNMIPADCSFVVDIRVPVGMEPGEVLAMVEDILLRHPGARMETLDVNPPAWCDPDGEVARLIRYNVVSLEKPDPKPIVSLGCTDARLWHYRNVPTYQYGPPPKGMGGADEHVEIDDFLHVVKVHALTAYDYLSRS